MKANFKNVIGNVKKNIVPEIKNTGMVVLGFVSGMLASKGIDKLIEKYPTADWLKYLKPAINGGGGLLIASASNDKHPMKYFGYGLVGAGVLDGVKLVPMANDFFQGLGDTAQLPTVYYTEAGNELPKLDLQGFGNSSIPVGNITLQAAEANEIELPDLEGATKVRETYTNTDLGYNGDSTRDSDDLSGLL